MARFFDYTLIFTFTCLFPLMILIIIEKNVLLNRYLLNTPIFLVRIWLDAWRM